MAGSFEVEKDFRITRNFRRCKLFSNSTLATTFLKLSEKNPHMDHRYSRSFAPAPRAKSVKKCLKR